MRFICEEISENTYVNIMAQYRPCGRAKKTEKLARGITSEEHQAALQVGKEEGIKRVDQREKWIVF